MKLFGLALLLSIIIPKQVITTIAGGRPASYSSTSPLAIDAVMVQPNQVTVDKQGNVYVAVSGSHVVSRISSDGVLFVIAGNHQPGYSGDGGLAINARLSPADVAIDKLGNIYIADMWNNRIRKINTLGVIYTYAGIGQPGFSGDGGPAVNARMKGPIAMVFDRKNNLLIAERTNHVIRKISPNGVISTITGGSAGFSGDGGRAVEALIDNPTDIAVDSKNNIYIADNWNHRIRRIDESGRISTFAGTGLAGCSADGTMAAQCLMNHPYGLYIDEQDNIYFSDNGNSLIRKIDSKGVVTTLAGATGKAGYTGDGGAALKSQIDNPGGLALDLSGNLLVADFGNNAVRKITNVGK